MAEIKVGDKEIEVDKNTEQRVKNMLSVNDLADYLNKYWTEEKLGKHKDMKKKHGEIILRNLKSSPKSLFKHLNSNNVNLELNTSYSIANILKMTKLDNDLADNYIKDAMAVTTTRPSIGKGEFLFASLFKNIGFASKSGDLINLDNDSTIEVKGKYSVLGNGQNSKFKPLTKSVLYSILKYAKIEDMSPSDLDADYVQKLKKKIGGNEKVLAKVFVALQNLANEYPPLGAVCAKLYLEKKQFLKVVAASHLLTYMNTQGFDFLLAHNNKKFIIFKKPTSMSEAYSIIEHFDVYSWKIGEYGVKVNLK